MRRAAPGKSRPYFRYPDTFCPGLAQRDIESKIFVDWQ
jgi:hypothetical protein